MVSTKVFGSFSTSSNLVETTNLNYSFMDFNFITIAYKSNSYFSNAKNIQHI